MNIESITNTLYQTAQTAQQATEIGLDDVALSLAPLVGVTGAILGVSYLAHQFDKRMIAKKKMKELYDVGLMETKPTFWNAHKYLDAMKQHPDGQNEIYLGEFRNMEITNGLTVKFTGSGTERKKEVDVLYFEGTTGTVGKVMRNGDGGYFANMMGGHPTDITRVIPLLSNDAKMDAIYNEANRILNEK